MYLFSKVFDAITTVYTIAILIVLGFLIFPRFFGITPYVVESPSMTPMISVGSVAYINTKDTTVTIGDVAAYRIQTETGETIVTHRIKAINEDGSYTFQGDANNIEDANSVQQSQIIGKYVFGIPRLGYLFAGREKTVSWILAGLVVSLNIFSAIFHKIAVSVNS